MALTCTVCQKPDTEASIKRCAKCTTTPYCSRECQKADWKTHKKVCGKTPGQTASSASGALSPPKGVDKGIASPFSRLTDNTWLHKRSEKDTYKLLIDAYRLRAEDDYNMTGDADDDSIYGGAPDGSHGFQRFLRSAQRRRNLLPGWWSPDKRRECEEFGMRSGEWQHLGSAVQKQDIIEHYGDAQFPMQLRMFAEEVLGSGPGGQNGSQMKRLMATMEAGNQGGHVSMMDALTGNVRDMQ